MNFTHQKGFTGLEMVQQLRELTVLAEDRVWFPVPECPLVIPVPGHPNSSPFVSTGLCMDMLHRNSLRLLAVVWEIMSPSKHTSGA